LGNNPVFNFEFDRCFVKDEEMFEPGTLVMKCGAITGFTLGRLIGVEIVHFDGMEVEDVLVQWDASGRFTAPGDSGCVYYAIRGNKRYPIAVHRGQTQWVQPNHVDLGGEDSRTYVSVGTPFSRVRTMIKKEIGELIWFDNFRGIRTADVPEPVLPQTTSLSPVLLPVLSAMPGGGIII
jgi:hypothetical protein